MRYRTAIVLSVALLSFTASCSPSTPPDAGEGEEPKTTNNASAETVRDASSDDQPSVVIEDDTELAFWTENTGSETGTNGGDYAYTICEFAGPNSTVVLAQPVSDWEFHPTAPGCDTSDDPYSGGYFDNEIDVLASVAGPSLPAPLTLVTFADRDIEGGAPERGRTFLGSVRESEGTYFLDFWVYADVVGKDVGAQTDTHTHDNVDLPTTWADLVSTAQATRDDYDAQCEPISNLTSLDEQEYHDYRYEADPKCPPDAGN